MTLKQVLEPQDSKFAVKTSYELTQNHNDGLGVRKNANKGGKCWLRAHQTVETRPTTNGFAPKTIGVNQFWIDITPKVISRMPAIISCGLYTFYPISHCSLYCGVISTTDKLCTKYKSSIFGPKIRWYDW